MYNPNQRSGQTLSRRAPLRESTEGSQLYREHIDGVQKRLGVKKDYEFVDGKFKQISTDGGV